MRDRLICEYIRYICQQMYCICHHVHQEAHLGVLHSPPSLQQPSCAPGASLGVLYLPAGVLHMPSCTPGSTLWWTAFPTKSTTDIMLIRSLTWCTVFTSRCTAYAIMYIRKHICVYCIPLQVYNNHHVHQEPHLVYYIYQQVYCTCHHVHQEAHFGGLHFPQSLQQTSC